MAGKIYTKTGDLGKTSLFGGMRLPKSHIRIEAYGTVDELNSWLGMLLDHKSLASYVEQLREIQNRLFTVGSNLASDPEKEMITPDLLEKDIEVLEKAIDHMNESLPALRHFILPGGHPAVSTCHIARTVCRRAERRVVDLSTQSTVDPIIIIYLNRLSDYLFVLGRAVGQIAGVEELKWHPRKQVKE